MAMYRDSMLGREDSQPEPVCGNAEFNSPLTRLPPELRLQILAELELGQLSALVHASSVFYRDYHCNRRYTLSKCLQVTLHDVAIDACAVQRSSQDEFAEAYIPDTVSQFLDSYQDQRSSAQNSHFTKHLSEDQAVRMAAFHSSLVVPVACHYVDWAMTNLPMDRKSCQDRGPLSKAEETRVFRALYRFQLCCNLFGKGCLTCATGHNWIPHAFPVTNVLELFLSLFEPWEVEEIICIKAFATNKHTKTFNSIHNNVDKWSPNFEGPRSPSPPRSFHFGIRDTRDSLSEGTMSRGLNILDMLFSTVWDHKQLLYLIQARITPSQQDLLQDAGSTETQSQLHNDSPQSHRQQKQNRRDPMPFTGVGDSETDEPRPPLAWTALHGEIYSSIFRGSRDDDPNRWGYVMWDDARLGPMDKRVYRE
ncbi:MAG: hypothetical protein M1839_005495 [Geoglossum umbratile]|nr:MAG: hypothetical protein M1839_005495 [Geoglossum umbratile]